MRSIRLILIILTTAICSWALNVMHVGNSLTDHAYGMHEIAKSKGYTSLMGRHMIPGAPVWWLWSHLADEFWDPVWSDKDANLTSNSWDALVLQMYRGQYTDDAPAAAEYVKRVRQKNPNCKVYVYAHHHTDLPDSFLPSWKANKDFSISQLSFEKAADSLAKIVGNPVYIIPSGQVLYEMSKRIAAGSVPGVSKFSDLFIGPTDIHLNNKGAYLVALVHYATIYKQNPANTSITGLKNISPDVPADYAQYVWPIVWDIVSTYSRTGVTTTEIVKNVPAMNVQQSTGKTNYYRINGRVVAGKTLASNGHPQVYIQKQGNSVIRCMSGQW